MLSKQHNLTLQCWALCPYRLQVGSHLCVPLTCDPLWFSCFLSHFRLSTVTVSPGVWLHGDGAAHRQFLGLVMSNVEKGGADSSETPVRKESSTSAGAFSQMESRVLPVPHLLTVLSFPRNAGTDPAQCPTALPGPFSSRLELLAAGTCTLPTLR